MSGVLPFVLGIVVGSAGNAIIDRLPRGESWFRGRSHCDKCKHTLGFWDLIPLLSYLYLGSKCRYCKNKIGIRNFLVELLIGTSFVVAPWQLWGLIWVTVVIAVMDWETRLVSELLVLLWGILVLAYQFSIFNLQFSINFLISNFQNNIAGLLVGLGIIGGIWAVTRGRAMGFGDVEIAAVMGWWLGWPKILPALWIAFVSGGVIGVIKIIKRSSNMKSEMAFGTFLVFGAWISYIWGEKLWNSMF